MIGRTNTGGSGGGGGLNFRVLGGTSAPPSPKENDIWVNTDVKISSYVISATQPTTHDSGLVWIPTGTSSTVHFNALKKNAIEVYPQSVKQYIGSEWVQIDAHIYHGGEWVQFSEIIKELYLYKPGDMCIEVTGGWTKLENGTVRNSSSELTIAVPGGHKAGGAKMVNQIDLTDYDYVVSEITGNVEMPLTIMKDGTNVASGNGTINISEITGPCEFRFYVTNSGSSGRTATVKSILLKK